MDQAYETFCMADRFFYDTLHSEETAGESFSTAARPLPAGWTRHEQDDWLTFGVESAVLPLQGWKIHVSACLDNAERVLDKVWEYCVPRGIEFKFLRSLGALVARVSKYAPRGYSGKLVTIYPPNESACETILNELGELLDGEPSPYVLTDLRWRRGPLYVRYGAFAMRYCIGDDDQIVPAIEDETGTLVPDRRDPVFYVPPWVRLPSFLSPALDARNAVTVSDLPYTIDRVVHFSNGGGIYVGTDTRTNAPVVLKEARPHSGLDAWGHDAVRRLEREYDMLSRLAGIPGVPQAYDLFWLGEHRFLAMEYVDATPLSRSIVLQYPLIDPSATEADFAAFTDWALDVYGQVEATMAAIHERGIVYGDLHLFNIMIRDDNTIALLDYEVASPIEDATPPGLGNQGFSAPPGTTGFDVDRYALACLRIALFLPMTSLLWLHPPKARHYADIIAEHFPVPAGFLTGALETIAPVRAMETDPPYIAKLTNPERRDWPSLRDDLTRAIVASATPQRDDRLFPGDIEQFAVGGLGLAYGAAGVLYALDSTGAGRFPHFEDWFVRRVQDPPSGTRPGLYDGLHGAAFVLDRLGYREQASIALERCLATDWESLGIDLASGLAGIGMNLSHFGERSGEPAFRTAAERAGELVAERLIAADRAVDGGDVDRPISGGGQPSAGLMRGLAGPASFMLQRYDDTGDTGYLDLAATALRNDLRRCVVRDNGSLEVDEGWRTMPYLDVGSIGIGMVIDAYLARRYDDEFAVASSRIERAARSKLYVLPGLFSGRAGILLYLASRSTSPSTDPAVVEQLRGLGWHALPYGDGIAFPGTALLRLSMDLATGTAGVLLAAGTVLHDEPVAVPLLVPTKTASTHFPSSTPQTPASLGAGAR